MSLGLLILLLLFGTPVGVTLFAYATTSTQAAGSERRIEARHTHRPLYHDGAGEEGWPAISPHGEQEQAEPPSVPAVPASSATTISSLRDLYSELEKGFPCNRIIDAPIIRLLVNQSTKPDRDKQSLWLAQLISKHTYLAATKSIPLNGTITGQPAAIPTDKSAPLYFLQLVCESKSSRPQWAPMVVFPTAMAGSYLQLRLPKQDLDACPLSRCDTKCSYTVHGGVRVMARSCCGAARAESDGDGEGEELCREDLRYVQIVLSVVCAFFALASLLLIPLIIHERRRQHQQESKGWALTEPLLFGATLLYMLPLLDWYGSASDSCVAAVWLREIGFTLFYGSILLKMFRNLREYRVRKAHHVVVREHDLFVYLAALLLLVLCALLAWSFGSTRNGGLRAASWPQCPFEGWSVMWLVYELALLVYGAWHCKAKSSSWMERYQFTLAILLETCVSIPINMIRYSLQGEGSSDALFIVTFVQLHLTITVNILVIVAPKLLLQLDTTAENSVRRTLTLTGAVGNNSGNRAHPSLAKLRDNLINGTIDLAEVPIVDMNPDDIRAELKRVYTQLRMYKLKNAYQDNPHISKRKGGGKKAYEKGIGKNRRISIPPTTALNITNAVTTPVPPSPKMSRLLEEEEEQKSDLTVESSPRNIYLLSDVTSVAAGGKLPQLLEMGEQASVRV